MVAIKEPIVLAISGIKNSGKTTVIENIIPQLTSKGLQVAIIKHDGHDFEADVKNTDSYRHKQAGAYGTAIFSRNKYMLVKEESVNEKQLFSVFKEADIILLEGFKDSSYPKIEVVRACNSRDTVCDEDTVIAYVTDFLWKCHTMLFSFTEIEAISEYIYNWYQNQKRNKGDL